MADEDVSNSSIIGGWHVQYLINQPARVTFMLDALSLNKGSHLQGHADSVGDLVIHPTRGMRVSGP